MNEKRIVVFPARRQPNRIFFKNETTPSLFDLCNQLCQDRLEGLELDRSREFRTCVEVCGGLLGFGLSIFPCVGGFEGAERGEDESDACRGWR